MEAKSFNCILGLAVFLYGLDDIRSRVKIYNLNEKMRCCGDTQKENVGIFLAAGLPRRGLEKSRARTVIIDLRRRISRC
jgi:hypothetical protein